MNQFNFLFSPEAEAIGRTLLLSIGQAFIIFICLRIVLKFIPKASSQVRYSLSYCAYLSIGAWFFISLIRQYSVSKSEAVIQKAIAINTFSPGVFESVSNIADIFSFSFLNKFLPLIVGFYLLGITWLSIRLLVNFFQTNSLRSKGLFELDLEWKQHIAILVDCMKISNSLQTFFSSKVNTPMIIGYLKPIILLPFATINQLSAKQFEAILLHELAHIRRNDYLLNIIQSVLDTLLFFNPFTWWITKYIREEREKSCDEMVLQFSDPYDYARALLSLEERRSKQSLMIAAVGKRSHLLIRIKNIMEMKNNHLDLRQKFIALMVIGLATISVAWLSPAKNSIALLKRNNNTTGNSIKGTSSTFFSLLNFRSAGDSIPPAPPTPPSPPIPPTPPVALTKNGIPTLPPAPPLPPLPPLAPIPPIHKEGIHDSIPSPISYFNSKEWKQQEEVIKKSSEDMRKYFQSDVWKKQQDLMRENALAMKKYFNGPEWQKQQELRKKIADQMKKFYSSPEWKKQQEMMKKNGEEMQKYFKSREWKKHQEDIRHATDSLSAYFKSDAWQKQLESIQNTLSQVQQNLQNEGR